MSISWKRLVTVSLWFVLSACSSRVGPEADIAPVAELVVIPTYTATVTPTPAKTVNTPEPALRQAFIAPTTDIPQPTPTKTPRPQPTATPTPVDWLKNVGRTGNNLIYLGHPNAPVTLIDYSDFM